MELQIKFLHKWHAFKVVDEDFVTHHRHDVLKVHLYADNLIEEFEREQGLLSGCVPDDDFTFARSASPPAPSDFLLMLCFRKDHARRVWFIGVLKNSLLRWVPLDLNLRRALVKETGAAGALPIPKNVNGLCFSFFLLTAGWLCSVGSDSTSVTDSSVAVSCITKFGSCKPKLNHITRDIWLHCFQRKNTHRYFLLLY